MAGTITWDLLRNLAGFRAGKGRVVSLYLNLDPSLAPTQPSVATRVNSLLDEAGKQEKQLERELPHDERLSLRADFARIERWFADEFDRDGAHGVAVFSDGPDGLWTTQKVPQPVEDGVRVNDEVYLAPLTGLVGSGDGALVAYVGRERAEVYRLEAWRLVEIADETEDAPSQHDQGGWSQARFERHIDTIVARHLKRVADSLDRCVRELRGVKVVLIGPEEVRPEFEDMLAKDVKEAVLGWTTAEAHAGRQELLAAAEPVLRDAEAAEERELLDRWREAAGRGTRATSGWEATLEAASDGGVDVLLIQERANRPAYRCPTDGRVQASGGNCPLDGTPMQQQSDGADLAVHRTLAFGGKVKVIRHHQDLDPVEGIGALLRFPASVVNANG
jgi:peptide chain release factor subunit 1